MSTITRADVVRGRVLQARVGFKPTTQQNFAFIAVPIVIGGGLMVMGQVMLGAVIAGGWVAFLVYLQSTASSPVVGDDNYDD